MSHSFNRLNMCSHRLATAHLPLPGLSRRWECHRCRLISPGLWVQAKLRNQKTWFVGNTLPEDEAFLYIYIYTCINPPTPADSKGSASEKRVQGHKTSSSITVWQQFCLLLAVEGTFRHSLACCSGVAPPAILLVGVRLRCELISSRFREQR